MSNSNLTAIIRYHKTRAPRGEEVCPHDVARWRYCEQCAYETRADYFAIDCNDPMFDVPEFVRDAETASWFAENSETEYV